MSTVTVSFVRVGERSQKVECVVCGHRGYDWGDVIAPWMRNCLSGHDPCPKCGKLLPHAKNDRHQVHSVCPRAALEASQR